MNLFEKGTETEPRQTVPDPERDPAALQRPAAGP